MWSEFPQATLLLAKVFFKSYAWILQILKLQREIMWQRITDRQRWWPKSDYCTAKSELFIILPHLCPTKRSNPFTFTIKILLHYQPNYKRIQYNYLSHKYKTIKTPNQLKNYSNKRKSKKKNNQHPIIRFRISHKLNVKKFTS